MPTTWGWRQFIVEIVEATALPDKLRRVYWHKLWAQQTGVRHKTYLDNAATLSGSRGIDQSNIFMFRDAELRPCAAIEPGAMMPDSVSSASTRSHRFHPIRAKPMRNGKTQGTSLMLLPSLF